MRRPMQFLDNYAAHRNELVRLATVGPDGVDRLAVVA